MPKDILTTPRPPPPPPPSKAGKIKSPLKAKPVPTPSVPSKIATTTTPTAAAATKTAPDVDYISTIKTLNNNYNTTNKNKILATKKFENLTLEPPTKDIVSF